jgi:hypothetical protein
LPFQIEFLSGKASLANEQIHVLHPDLSAITAEHMPALLERRQDRTGMMCYQHTSTETELVGEVLADADVERVAGRSHRRICLAGKGDVHDGHS